LPDEPERSAAAVTGTLPRRYPACGTAQTSGSPSINRRVRRALSAPHQARCAPPVPNLPLTIWLRTGHKMTTIIGPRSLGRVVLLLRKTVRPAVPGTNTPRSATTGKPICTYRWRTGNTSWILARGPVTFARCPCKPNLGQRRPSIGRTNSADLIEPAVCGPACDGSLFLARRWCRLARDCKVRSAARRLTAQRGGEERRPGMRRRIGRSDPLR
jgi:hypothetical protein